MDRKLKMLNSIIIEGSVLNRAVDHNAMGSIRTTLVIQNTFNAEKICVTVRIFHDTPEDIVNRKVRVVGSLHNGYVLADHIEIQGE